MRYQGEKAPIRIGRGGLMTDLPPSDIPDTHLLEAKNVIVQDGTIQKDRGSRRWNLSALASAIVALREWMPVEARSYVYAITRAGSIYRFLNREERTQITREVATDPSALTISENNAFIVEGGEETPGNPRKLFIFSHNNQVQVITAAGITYNTLSTPSADFSTSNYPHFGIVHQNRLWVFLPHRVYASTTGDHENFTGAGSLQFAVFPGEGERLVSAYVFRKQLFMFKRGGGFYQLIDSDVDSDNWYIQRAAGEFGVGAHEAIAEVAGDLLAANDKGSITSLAAVERFGDVDQGDTFNLLKVKRYLSQFASGIDIENRRMLYDTHKQALYITHRPNSAINNHALWKLDFSQDRPEITIVDKDQANCLAALTVPTGIEKPFYGAEDGYIYEMDCEDREIGLVHNPVAPLAALGSGAGSLDNATYRFRISFASASDESLWSAPTEEVTVSNAAVNGKIELTQVPVDTTGSATKRIVLGKKSTDSVYTKVAEIADNTTTTYTVNSAPSGWTTVTQPSLNTFNTTYEMAFQLPHLSLQHVNPALVGIQKHYDFVEIGYKSTGPFDVACQYWIDGIHKRTRNFQVSKSPLLDDFVLDTDRLNAGAPRWVRFKLHGAGSTFSARFSNSGQLQNAIITDINLYFRLSNEDQKAVKSGKAAS